MTPDVVTKVLGCQEMVLGDDTSLFCMDESCFKKRATVLVVRLYMRTHDKVTPHYMHLVTKVFG